MILITPYKYFKKLYILVKLLESTKNYTLLLLVCLIEPAALINLVSLIN